jgi:hypothetical protein
VSIFDDKFEANLAQEQQGGTETYEFEVDKSSGMQIDVSAKQLGDNGDITVVVYENGKEVARDTDPAYAQIID